MNSTDDWAIKNPEGTCQPPPVLSYATPLADISPGEPPPAYKLFNASAVTLATFLGSPLAGAFLIALNFHRLNRKRAANVAILLGVIGTASLFGIAFVLPEGIPPLLIGLPPLILMNSLAKFIQGKELQLHAVRHGQLGSRWVAAGIALICLALVFILLFVGVFIEGAGIRAKTINYSPVEEIRFSGKSNQSDALKLGDLLKQIQFFDGQRSKTVLVEKNDARTAVSFVLNNGRWDDPIIVAFFRRTGESLAASLGRPLLIRLCNSELVVKKEITIE